MFVRVYKVKTLLFFVVSIPIFCICASVRIFDGVLTLSLLAALITFQNGLDPYQDRHNVGPDLDPINPLGT